MPAVKANAYGHGAIEISRELSHLGIHAFCVASVDEGIELRQALECSGMLSDNVSEILILGYTHPDQFYLLQRYQLTQTAVNFEHAMAIAEFGRRYHVKLQIHLKIDTGMRRLGIKSENRLDVMQVLSSKHLDVTGIYTHFSTRNYDFTLAQAQRFDALLTFITDSSYSLPKIHSQSSYGVFACQNYTFDHAFDYARVGLALYGIHANEEGSSVLPDLRPVLSLRARISCVKDIRAGEFIGYGAEFQASRDMRIAVLSIGYADGVPRSLSNGVGQVLVNGSVAKVVGLICMDQMTVDISDIDDVCQGGTVTLIGKDGDKEIKVVDIARQAGTIPNEILSRLGSRLDR
jgi:serine/alanine racemase